MSNQITETHLRTLVKSAIYRVISVVISFCLALAFGATTTQALQVGAVALFIGAVHYYLYERLCLFISWGRDADGHDSKTRSIIKTILYRISVLVVIMITSRIIFLDDTFIAFVMASIKFLTHATTYFILERLFNKVEWGKVGTP